MNILFPDKSNFLLKKYHLSNHLLIPGLLLSYGADKLDSKEYAIVKNTINFTNVLNIGYHSYFSTSAIISDYIKPKYLSNFVRSSSLGLHTLAVCGLCKYLKK